MTVAVDKWLEQEAGRDCYLCPPRIDAHPDIMLIANLSASSLYLAKDQRFLGQSSLILTEHLTKLDALPEKTYLAYGRDLRRSVRAIRECVRPDHVNIALLGNSCPHLHWSIIPRYRIDPRWGRPVWEDSTLQEMRGNPVTLTEVECIDMIEKIRSHL